MNNTNGTENIGAVGHTQVIKWSAISCKLWCRLTIVRGIMVVKPLKYIKWDFFFFKSKTEGIKQENFSHKNFICGKM
jgi:hypothetical protein